MNAGKSKTCGVNCSIFDIPKEILPMIISHLNARERVAFANTSSRFYSVVFGNKQLLRDLNFSEEGRLTTISDIREYFKDDETSKQILKVNLTNVTCITSPRILKDTLYQGTNLVDVNIQGIEFRDIFELGSFIEPLKHLERLSIDWPKTTREDVDICREILCTPFSKLIYLSVRMRWTNYCAEFIASLNLCEKLEELRIVQLCLPVFNHQDIQGILYRKLENLRIIEYCGYGAIEVMNHIGFLFTDPREWRYFAIAPNFPLDGFYFERHVEYGEVLSQPHFDLRDYPLYSDCLLMQIIMRTCEYTPRDFCCLSDGEDDFTALMKIEEIKLLLKNSLHGISYLNIQHSIESYCSVHLLASIFPNLTELVLTSIIIEKERSSIGPHPMKHLRRLGTPDTEDLRNINNDSCFKMLVENTPHMKSFTLDAEEISLPDDEEWDFEALQLIAGWANLRSLHLKNIPVQDGEFLIEIGRKCSVLETLELENLVSCDSCCLVNELAEMLGFCRSLEHFTLRQNNLGQVSTIIPLLAYNPELKKIYIRSRSRNEKLKKLISASEHIIEQCPKLNTLYCVIDGMKKSDSDELALAFRRIRLELSRPTLQFQVIDDKNAEDLVLEDYVPPSFPWNLGCFDLP